MKKITKTMGLLFAFTLSLSVVAQDKKGNNVTEKCLADQHNASLRQAYPNMMGSEVYENQMLQKIQEIKAQAMAKTNSPQTVVTIPVVVHVLHNGEPIGTGPNITDAQVESQITVFNEDYRRMTGTPGYNNHPDGTDVEVEFVLALRTPDGCPTNGIDRVNICMDGVNQSQMETAKTQTYWDASSYLNMWSAKFVGDLSSVLGYAQFPGGPANTDGVTCNYTTFGSSDYNDGTFALSPPYDKGRTMTHEVGHFLGLYHTFQGGCGGGGDLCDDTPEVDNPNFGCPTGHASCGTVDMIENYMDYTDDTCMNTFTNDQKARILAVLATENNRFTLPTSNAGTPLADVSLDAEVHMGEISTSINNCVPTITPNVVLKNWGTTTLTSATIDYEVDGAPLGAYAWSGSLASGASETISLGGITGTGGSLFTATVSLPNGSADARTCNDSSSVCIDLPVEQVQTTEINLELTTDNWCEETTWEFTDSSNTVLYLGGSYTQNVQDNTTFNETFTVMADECYTFTIYDEYGDGICCGEGPGSYTLTDDEDNVIFSGGEFGSEESTIISTASFSTSSFDLKNQLTLYPNPTSEVLNIKMSNNELPDNYTVYNMLGQVMAQKAISSQADLSVSTSQLSNGMYLIKIAKDGNQATLQFVKK